MTPALLKIAAELGADISVASSRHGVRVRLSHLGETIVDVGVRRAEGYHALEAEDACADAALRALASLMARVECTAQARSVHTTRPS